MNIGKSRLATQATFLFLVASLHTAFSGTISSIGTLPGDGGSSGAGINSSGAVAATSTGAQNSAFIYQGGDINWVPGISGSAQTFATGIGSSGAVVGYSFLTSSAVSPFHAFVNTGAGGVDLGALPGGFDSSANAINSSNQIAGSSETASGNVDAVIFANGVITDLGTLGGDAATGLAINDIGTVVGWSRVAGSAAQNAAEFFSISGLGVARIDLGALGGFIGSSATAINNSGGVAGWGQAPGSTNFHAFAYNVNGSGFIDLGLLPGTDNSEATSINSRGIVVGNSQAADGSSDPFVWASGDLLDLNSFLPANSGWQLLTASGINDAGLVTGSGIFNGQDVGYVLDTGLHAAPEPAAFWLLGLGLFAIGLGKKKGVRSRG